MSGALDFGYAVVIGITQAAWKGPHADSVLVMVWVDLATCYSAVQPSDKN